MTASNVRLLVGAATVAILAALMISAALLIPHAIRLKVAEVSCECLVL